MIKNLRGVGLLLALVGCRGGGPGARGAYQGVVELEQRVLSFEVAGRITSLTVDRGDHLEANALVARLDESLERQALAARAGDLAVARAQADLVSSGTRAEDVKAMQAQVSAASAAEARLSQDLARAEKLASAGAQTPAVVDDLSARLRQATAERQALDARLLALRRGARPSERAGADARAEAAAAAVRLEEARLAKYELRAPAAGVVVDRHMLPGEVATPGGPVVTVGDARHPYVDVFVPQAELAGIAVGARAVVRTDALPAGLPGKVERISPRTEFTPKFLFSERERGNLVIRVRVRVADPGETLHAGVPAFVDIDRAGGGGHGG
jgi:HlyD family secretion protein